MLIATQRQRLYIANLIMRWKDDINELEEIYNNLPKTTERYKFGDNRQLIIKDRLYKLPASDARKVITGLTAAEGNEYEREAIKILINKLK